MNKPEEKHFVYVLECSDGSLYTGWTPHLSKRLEAHNNGKGAKYTKGRRPVTLRYAEEFDNKNEALRREYEIKQMSRKEKMNLIQEEEKQTEE